MIFQDIIRSTKRILRLFPHERVQEELRVSLSQGRKKVRDVMTSGRGNLSVLRDTETQEISISPLTRNLEEPTRNLDDLPRHRRVLWWATKRNPLRIFAVLGVVTILALILTLQLGRAFLLKERIRVEAMQGYAALFDIREEFLRGNRAGVAERIDTAGRHFNRAEAQLREIAGFQRFLSLEGTDVAVLWSLLSGGKELALAAEKFQTAMIETSTLLSSTAMVPGESLTDRIRRAMKSMEEGIAYFRLADDKFRRISSDAAVRANFDRLSGMLDRLNREVPVLMRIFGDAQPRRYMILLQNQDEIRPTGGFIGSLLFVTLEKGGIKEWLFQDIYNLDGQMEKKIPAPYPLSLITENFGMRDSNISPDFPASAQAALGLLETAKWGHVDGVLAVNQGFVIDLLRLTGPISIPERKITLDADNFSVLLSAIVESKIDRDQPKTVLKEFIPLFMTRLQNADSAALLDILLTHIAERNLAIYFTDPEAETLAHQYALAGELAPPRDRSDFLLLSETSVSGNKSDRLMEQQLKHETFVDEYGYVTNEVTLTRLHGYTPAVAEQWQKIMSRNSLPVLNSDMLDLLGRGENKTYVEWYVPLGSTLQGAEGVSKSAVRVEQKHGYQVYGLLMTTDTGGQSRVTLTYQLPHVLNLAEGDSYRLLLQKQVGGKKIAVEKQIFVDNRVEFQDAFPVAAEEKKYDVLDTLYHTLQFSALLTRTK